MTLTDGAQGAGAAPDTVEHGALPSRSSRSEYASRARGSRRPQLGFLGVGWIGRHRMQAIVEDGCAEVAALADAAHDQTREALRAAPGARVVDSLDSLLELDLDGVVIATPSALHAEQASRALQAGLAVFCQKPLARTAAEVAQVLAAARDADRLLGVDLSYRHTAAMLAVRQLIGSGALGEIYAVDLVFHNAYGPDKPWFRDVALAGGGCVIDLGIHLVDLALWVLDWPAVEKVTSRLYAGGKRLAARPEVVEDYATAELELAGGVHARLACSWNLSAGCDAVIEATFHGSSGSATFRNVNGSFYDFVAEHYRGTARERLVEPPDEWGGRAATLWARELSADGRYDSDVGRMLEVAQILDAIYGR